MYALLVVALLGAGQDTTRPPSGAGAGAGDRGRDLAGHPSLDGSWMVVAYERDGSPVTGATSHTATLRGNTLSFSTGRSGSGGTGTGTGTGTDRPAGGTGTDRPGAGAGAGADAAFGSFRIDFGPRGTVRVTEMGAGGAGTGTGTGTGTDRSGAGAG